MNTRTIRKAYVLFLSVFSLFAISNCLPYRVETVDYNSPQRAAAILVGDPQVYARASLINDRRRELEYLQQLLANSAVDKTGRSIVTFSPQIIRDLKTVQNLSANLGLSAGKTIPDTSTAADVSRQIETAKLQAQLAVLQKQLEGIQSAAAPQVTIPQPALTSETSPATSSAAGNVTMPDLSALQNDIKSIQAQLQALPAVNGPTPPGSNYAALSDPRDDFADRQAYRRDIRAALAQAQLDDVHDRGGNALYRLQFQIAVLPPRDGTRQWGAARMTIGPPQLTPQDVESAYFEWLAYLSRMLSNALQAALEDEAKVGRNRDLDRYITQLGGLTYFNVIDLFRKRELAGETFACLDHRTTEDAQRVIRMEEGKEWLGTYAVPPLLITPSEDCEAYPALDADLTFSKPLQVAKAVISWIGAAAPNAASVRPRGQTRDTFAFPHGSKYAEKRITYVPESFCEALVDRSRAATFCEPQTPISAKVPAPAAGGWRAGDERGDAVRSYSVLPTELAQRLGVTTEASQSLQTALTVAAQLSAVAKSGLSAGYLAQADARAQALVRQPVVVGFAGSEQTMASDKAATVARGFFGWLFGPEFSITDSKTLALQHGVRSYGVNADVSFPGWWNYVTLDVTTAWIRNWEREDVAAVMSDGHTATTRKRVTLPVSDAMYESLTNFVASRQYGPQNSRIFISSVTPTLIPTCTSKVTFQILGGNIWRADAIYLGGVRASAVSVLPDMNGVTAEFDMDGVYGTLANATSGVQIVPLMVFAGQGSAGPQWVYIVGKRQTINGATSCQSPFLVPTNADSVRTTIVSVSPSEICSDATHVPLVLQGMNLPGRVAVHSPHFTAGSRWAGDWYEREIDLYVRPGVKLTPGPLAIALTYKESSSVEGTMVAGSMPLTLTVKDCTPAPARSNATLTTTSVKIAKEQPVTLRSALPKSYHSIVVAIRRQTETGDARWIESASSKVLSGESGEVTGLFDLSGLNAKPGDELEVVIRIRASPEVEWQQIQADKTLKVTGGA